MVYTKINKLITDINKDMELYANANVANMMDNIMKNVAVLVGDMGIDKKVKIIKLKEIKRAIASINTELPPDITMQFIDEVNNIIKNNISTWSEMEI